MKLVRLERQILRFIDKQFPNPWNPVDSGEIIAMGERPLPSREDVARHFAQADGKAVADAIAKLVAYQCIAKVYLHAKGDFSEFRSGARRVSRALVAAPGKGIDAFQITAFGKTTIAGFWGSKLGRLGMKWLGLAVEKIIPFVIVFILGFLSSAIFGIDIRKPLGMK